jgi:hypothetical protein
LLLFFSVETAVMALHENVYFILMKFGATVYAVIHGNEKARRWLTRIDFLLSSFVRGIRIFIYFT